MHVSRFTCPEIASMGTESVHAPKYAVQGVDPARPGGHVDYAGFPGDTGVAFGGHGRGLLVMVADVTYPRLPAEGIVQMHGAAAGDHENPADAPIGQLADHVMRKLNHGCASANLAVACHAAVRRMASGRSIHSSSPSSARARAVDGT